MCPTPFDWSRRIAENNIPSDVTFQIVENGLLHEVKAHKTILGLVSPTFNTMFFGTDVGDKTAEVIKIEETTAPAFQIMIDAVYNTKSIGDSLKGKSIDEVFDVVNLVERYQIAELMRVVKEQLDKYPITDDTVMEVAGEALEYKRLFEDEAQHLLIKCAKFLMPKLKDANSMIRYAAKNRDRGEVFAALLALMNDMINTCRNCKKEVCLNGEIVKEEDFREGLVVTNNRDCSWWMYDDDFGRLKIIDNKATNVVTVTIKRGLKVHLGSGGHVPKVCPNNVPVFRFSCKYIK